MIEFKNIKKIYEGWKNLTFKNKEVEKIAIERLKICDSCPRLNNNLIPTCGVCGCVIDAKVRSLTSKCPLEKW